MDQILDVLLNSNSVQLIKKLFQTEKLAVSQAMSASVLITKDPCTNTWLDWLLTARSTLSRFTSPHFF